MARVAVAPTKKERGFDGTVKSGLRKAYEQLELLDALHRVYTTDAHLVVYVIEGQAEGRQFRLNKDGLPFVPFPVTCDVLFADVDNPGHADWDAAREAEVAALWNAAPPPLTTAGFYRTDHGHRLVQPLDRPVPVTEVEGLLRSWHAQLRAAGVAVDKACSDWTHQFRLPFVRRERRAGEPALPASEEARVHAIVRATMDLSRMRPVPVEDLRAVGAPTSVPAPSAMRRTVAAVQPVWSADVPAACASLVEALARAAPPSGGRHAFYLVLAGALLRGGLPGGDVPAVLEALAARVGSKDPLDVRRGAHETVGRFLAGLPVTGMATLLREYPTAAAVLDGFELSALAAGPLPEAAEGLLPPEPVRVAAPSPVGATSGAAPSEAPSLAETLAALEDAIATAPDGLTLLGAQCGLGKTQAAIRVAARRAATTSASRAPSARAPLHSKTAISVDKNALALQVVGSLRRAGVAAKRLFGPLSLRDADGNPVCKLHDVALPLVEGGQSIHREFCTGRGRSPCVHAGTCRAKDGVEGPDDARVVVSTHPLVPTLDREAGTTGLLIIDEPPPLLESYVLSPASLAHAERLLERFEAKFAKAMAPVLATVRAWAMADEELTPLADVLALDAGSDDGGPSHADALRALEHTGGPPLRVEQIALAIRSPDYARDLGAASHVFAVLHAAAVCEAPVMARVEHRGLLLVMPAQRLERALRREGPVVVMDANVGLHRAGYAKVVGYEPPYRTFAARDGAPITRTLLRCGTANRSSWLKGGRVTLAPSLLAAVRLVFQTAPPGKLAVITMMGLELALAAALERDVRNAWIAAGQPRTAYDVVVRTLGPLVRAYPGEVVLGHYGGLRGLDSMADADALVTLGDPWSNLGDVEAETAYANDGEWQKRATLLAQAELEQAHGRLRVIHRTKPAKALHVGRLLPSGPGWEAENVRVVRLPIERAPRAGIFVHPELGAAVARAGGLRAAARLAAVDKRTLRRYLDGEHALPREVADRLGLLVCRGSPNDTEVGRSRPIKNDLKSGDSAPLPYRLEKPEET